MFGKFNLTLTDNEQKFFRNFSGSTPVKEYSYKQEIEKYKQEIKENLKKFVDSKGELKGSEIIANWFPNIEADVFLSHSHADEKLVIGISKWLKEKFKLNSFIDSTVWGYADHLLEIIDDEYSVLDHRNSPYDQNHNYQKYDYTKRNRSTSHVHMMLSTALMNMMDRCECLIFVNTPNSFTPKEYIKNNNQKGTTTSPWIYSEIAMAKMLRPKREKMFSQEMFNEDRQVIASLNVNYDVNFEDANLVKLAKCDLDTWEKKNESLGLYKHDSLNLLYKMTKQNNG